MAVDLSSRAGCPAAAEAAKQPKEAKDNRRFLLGVTRVLRVGDPAQSKVQTKLYRANGGKGF